jgi:hypothetical protein
MMSGDYALAYGTHASPQDGRCAMEWVSHLAGEAHSDEPSCVSPVLRAMCIALNDGLEHAPRQRLRPHLVRTIGTAGDGLDIERGWMAMDWLIRVYTPAWLRLGGLHSSGDRLAMLAPVDGSDSLRPALARLETARRAARSARAQAFGVALPTGWAAAVAGRDAAWACAGAAAWAAARLGIGDAAGDRARAASRATAGDAAAIAIRDAQAASPGGRMRAVASAALAPTLDALADSALTLLERMLPTEFLAMPGVADTPAGIPVLA